MVDTKHTENSDLEVSLRTKLTLCTNAQQVASVVYAYFEKNFEHDQKAVQEKRLSLDIHRTTEQLFHTMVHDRLDEIYREQPQEFDTDIKEVEPELQTYLRQVFRNFPAVGGSGYRRI